MGIADNHARFTLRIPDSLHRTLLKQARRNQRSFNGEIISLLEGQSHARKTVTLDKELKDNWDLKIEQLPPSQKRAIRHLINSLVSSFPPDSDSNWVDKHPF